MLLIHPACANGGIAVDPRYRHSASFYASPWRQQEYESLLSLGSLDRS
jgi:hypothetical protein